MEFSISDSEVGGSEREGRFRFFTGLSVVAATKTIANLKLECGAMEIL